MTEDPVIETAENKMYEESMSATSPWATQFLMLLFITPVIGIPLVLGLAVRTVNPHVDPTIGQEWVFFISIFASAGYGLKMYQRAHAGQWLNIGYNGSSEWADSLKIKGEPIDYGEAKPEVNASGELTGKIKVFRYGRPVEAPKAIKNGHLWGIKFERKSLPELDVWLPEDFEKCCKFIGHSGLAFQGWLPFSVKHISYVAFIRTDWTQDPDKTVVPIGMFTDYDLLRAQLKQNLEPRIPTREEMKVLANVRDNYYRDEAVKELEIEKGKTRNLQQELKQMDKVVDDRIAAVINNWNKGGKKSAPKGSFAPTRKQKLFYIGLVLLVMILGIVLMVKH